jgi:hypothetical protein
MRSQRSVGCSKLAAASGLSEGQSGNCLGVLASRRFKPDCGPLPLSIPHLHQPRSPEAAVGVVLGLIPNSCRLRTNSAVSATVMSALATDTHVRHGAQMPRWRDVLQAASPMSDACGRAHTLRCASLIRPTACLSRLTLRRTPLRTSPRNLHRTRPRVSRPSLRSRFGPGCGRRTDMWVISPGLSARN